MSTDFKAVARSNWASTMMTLGSIVLMIGVLRWAREIFIPIALAVLLSFILSPVVTWLRRWGLGKATSVCITVALMFLLIGGIGTMIMVEVRSFANALPKYRENILTKISDVRILSRHKAIQNIRETVNEIIAEFKKEPAPSAKATPAVPVVVTGGKSTPQSTLPSLGPLVAPLASAAWVVVLLIFMLLRREDLRDRLLRLVGDTQLATTTKGIDEAGQKVSHYLSRLSLINAGFGLGVGIGLAILGLPYSTLWGFLAAMARFVPYVGPWLGILPPMLLSLTIFQGWTAPVIVLGLVAGLEVLNYFVLEPLLYSKGIGVSEVSLLVMVAFWTWLWGPIGVVLAAPLTVCLMVISKIVPDLKFVSILLGDGPALDPTHLLYQRLVAHDQDGAKEIVAQFLKEHSQVELFDELLIPALIASRRDYEQDKLTDEDHESVLHAIEQIVKQDEALTVSNSETILQAPVAQAGADLAPRPLILGCPGNDQSDELGLSMLAHLLQTDGWPMRVLSPEMLASEIVAEVEHPSPAVVCIGLLPGPLFRVRQFCKRLRVRFPGLVIVVGVWGTEKREKIQEQLSDSVQAIGWSLAETKNQVSHYSQIDPNAAPPSETTKELALSR